MTARRNGSIKGIIICFLVIVSAGFLWFCDGKEQEIPVRSGALNALKMMNSMRSYPGDDIDEGTYYRTWEEFHQPYISNDLREDEWQSIGPDNLGARTLSITFNPINPNTIYAGSASGGLWRSYTGGVGADAWERVWTGFPALSISTIAISPIDTNTIFIGTGEVYDYRTQGGIGGAVRTARGTYGIGILKSSDGGETWEQSLDWTTDQKRGVWAIRMNPLNPNTVWAATTNGTYKSIDGGVSWIRKHAVIMANDLTVNPLDTNNIVVGCGNFDSSGDGIYYTNDGGTTWNRGQNVPDGFYGKIHLSVSNSNPNIVYASIGGGEMHSWLCRSIDGGANWTTVNTTDYAAHQGWFSHDVSVNPQNPNSLFVVGVDAYKSTDAGVSIQVIATSDGYSGLVPPEGPEGPSNYMHHDYHDITYHPTDTSIVYFASDGGVFRTMDGGASFQSLNGGYITSQFYYGFSSSQTDSNLALGGFQDNATAVYDGNMSWRVRYLSRSDGSWTAVHPQNDSILYASKQWTKIYRSINGGETWSSILNPPWSGSMAFIGPFVISPSEPDIMYAGSQYVYKSINGGTNWLITDNDQNFNTSGVYGMAISHQTSDVVYITTIYGWARPSVWRTGDGGATWTDLTGDLPNRYFTAITVDPTDDSKVYLVVSGFGTSHCFRSTDSGDTWQDIGAGLPDVPTNAIIVDPLYPHNLYLGNDLGVYISDDYGNNWGFFSEGLNEAVIAQDFSISGSNRKIRVATHGNGAYERNLAASPVGVVTEKEVPSSFALKQNYPNLFNPQTTIEFQLSDPGPVTLTIYNELGQTVKTLIRNEWKQSGIYKMSWKPENQASGTYIYTLKAGGHTQTKTMIYIK